MSQLSSKAGPVPPGPARHSPEPGTFEDVAGFRIGRGGRNNGAPQTRPQHPPHGQQAPQGPSYGYPPAPQPYQGQQQYGGGYGGQGGPEDFGDGGDGYAPH